jgi:hypothetical protein
MVRQPMRSAARFVDRPVLRPVEAIQVVDVFGREHGRDFLYPAEIASTRLLLVRGELGTTAGRKQCQGPDLHLSWFVVGKIANLRF